MGEPLTPVEAVWTPHGRRDLGGDRRRAYVAGLALFRRFNPDAPTVHSDIHAHFKYDSIGSEPANGIPYWIWKVLPDMFPEKLPPPGNGYASFGFVFEPGKELPIGLAQRKVIIPRLGMNCAVCHTGTVRDTPESKPRIYLGMPANTFDLQAYLQFLIDCASDSRFTADNVCARSNADEADPIRSSCTARRCFRRAKLCWTARAASRSHASIRPGARPRRHVQSLQDDAVQLSGLGEGPSRADRPSVDLESGAAPRDATALGRQQRFHGGAQQERRSRRGRYAGIHRLEVHEAHRGLDRQLPAPKYPYTVDDRLAARGAAASMSSIAPSATNSGGPKSAK